MSHCLLVSAFIKSGGYLNWLWPFWKTNLSVLATMQSSNPRILKFGNNPGCPCGGTHVSDISEIMSMKVISYVLMFYFLILCLELRHCIFLCFWVKKKSAQFTDFTVLSQFAVSRQSLSTVISSVFLKSVLFFPPNFRMSYI